ncbi:hypothetical protein LCGC14_0249700 [marine sediment metagenome]|uniref:Uncharacterized protein n=1 Tax=marine sediment metagenome TaxID=412755 RepID=A0A0F9ULS5_9ZZZZ
MPTGISYLDEVWQPVTGCSPCSPGCENCYAATMAQTGRLRNHRRYRGLSKHAKSESGLTIGKWTGEVRCNEEDLTQPLRWKKPRTIGTVFMGDLFHPAVPFAFLDKVFAVMALCLQHTFVTCMKRAERMREYLTESDTERRVAAGMGAYRLDAPWRGLDGLWPLPNVHLGVTVESHGQTNRIVHLLKAPAAHRWLSIEPMLGPVDLTNVANKTRPPAVISGSVLGSDGRGFTPGGANGTGIDGVILGCESGPNRRPFDLDWARRVRDDCQAAGVKLYVKQLSIDGKVVTAPALFPEGLRSRELSWKVNK